MTKKKLNEKENKVCELTDEQANEATGGKGFQSTTSTPQFKCGDCGNVWEKSAENGSTVNNLICPSCGGTKVTMTYIKNIIRGPVAR